MARRALLSEAWWQQATIIPDNEREIAKHYTLDRSDLDLIMRQNKAANRLGLACVLATLRYPGRPLADGEVLPAGVLRFLARQIGVDHHEIERYFERPQTRREHLALLFDRMQMRPFCAFGRAGTHRLADTCRTNPAPGRCIGGYGRGRTATQENSLASAASARSHHSCGDQARHSYCSSGLGRRDLRRPKARSGQASRSA